MIDANLLCAWCYQYKGNTRYFCSRKCSALFNYQKNKSSFQINMRKGDTEESLKIRKAILDIHRTKENQSRRAILLNKKIWTPEFRKRMSELASKRARGDSNFGKGMKYGCKRYPHFSHKAGTLSLRSTWEQKFAKFLDDNREVVTFEYEPFYVEYQGSKSNNRYYPDFLVLYKNGHQEVIEIKPSCHLDKPIVINKLNSLRLYCEDKNMGLSIVSEVN